MVWNSQPSTISPPPSPENLADQKIEILEITILLVSIPRAGRTTFPRKPRLGRGLASGKGSRLGGGARALADNCTWGGADGWHDGSPLACSARPIDDEIVSRRMYPNGECVTSRRSPNLPVGKSLKKQKFETSRDQQGALDYPCLYRNRDSRSYCLTDFM